MMHCGGMPSTRCLSRKKLRQSGHSGHKSLVASSITNASCGAVPPRFSSLLPSTPSNLEVRSHKQQAEVRKREIPELDKSYNATAHIFSSLPAGDVLSVFRQSSAADSVNVTFNTGKECRDHRREPDVVRSRLKARASTINSGKRRALEDLLARSCRRVCVVCTFELYGSCGRVWLACTLHICIRPTKGATGLAASDPDSPNGMQRTGPGRVPIAAPVVLVQAPTWVDRGVGNPALRRGALIGCDRSLWQLLGSKACLC